MRFWKSRSHRERGRGIERERERVREEGRWVLRAILAIWKENDFVVCASADNSKNMDIGIDVFSSQAEMFLEKVDCIGNEKERLRKVKKVCFRTILAGK